MKNAKAKPWMAQIKVIEDGKRGSIHIGTFGREEDAARARDRVSIAKLGHAKAKTNFPVAEYRAEWAELEELGLDEAVAWERERAAADRVALGVQLKDVTAHTDAMNEALEFWGVDAEEEPGDVEIRTLGLGWFAPAGEGADCEAPQWALQWGPRKRKLSGRRRRAQVSTGVRLESEEEMEACAMWTESACGLHDDARLGRGKRRRA